ncbi:hypothetical protein FHR70_001651 [Microvirga lupini]|uniref:Uncharacterized protein n=1 Tax=Microvirga lupini TaxID=420324 RepID=A0A7W4VK05_9HYPH|nr:hypothetical protein [Microvirga lupini]MBB3018597.1 hypothetical protein [Microvirga lupini]
MADTFKNDAPSAEKWMGLLTSVRVAASALDLTQEQCAEIPAELDEEMADNLLTNAQYLDGLTVVMLAAASHVTSLE